MHLNIIIYAVKFQISSFEQIMADQRSTPHFPLPTSSAANQHSTSGQQSTPHSHSHLHSPSHLHPPSHSHSPSHLHSPSHQQSPSHQHSAQSTALNLTMDIDSTTSQHSAQPTADSLSPCYDQAFKPGVPSPGRPRTTNLQYNIKPLYQFQRGTEAYYKQEQKIIDFFGLQPLDWATPITDDITDNNIAEFTQIETLAYERKDVRS